MNADLERLAAACGLQRSYRGLDGRMAGASDEALIALLKVLGVDAHDGESVSRLLAEKGERQPPALRAPEGVACHLPAFLEQGRAWGITCQLYGLRSRRNWGIGDFEDLARLGELVASLGADFLGANPLHALFLAEPEWNSPFSPAHRSFLNPLYIAVDHVEGYQPSDADEDQLRDLRAAGLVDYGAVTQAKLDALRAIFRRSRKTETPREEGGFIRDGGDALRKFALFQVISMEMKRLGLGAGWLSWPEEFRDPDGDEVRRLAEEHGEEVEFQVWLQSVADRQLAAASRRLREAGMRIGLYLDLAVGTSPDGAATWSDPALTVIGAEIGAPPDMFNPEGQKWGLAPLSPPEIEARGFSTIRRSYESILRHAGALRIDHAMSLYRLFWIPWNFPAGEGAYALYPMTEIVRVLAEVSQEKQAVIIGEDLGVVPEGFRNEMERANLLGYRIFYFERNEHGFVPPEHWPRAALACVGSHDTPTLAGWWTGSDIELRQEIGLYDAAGTEQQRQERRRDKREALQALHQRGWRDAGEDFSEAVAVAVHRLVAKSPCRLVAAQLEDLLGLEEQPNIPGTVNEHPNWRRKMPLLLEEIESSSIFKAVLQAFREERPRNS